MVKRSLTSSSQWFTTRSKPLLREPTPRGSPEARTRPKLSVPSSIKMTTIVTTKATHLVANPKTPRGRGRRNYKPSVMLAILVDLAMALLGVPMAVNLLLQEPLQDILRAMPLVLNLQTTHREITTLREVVKRVEATNQVTLGNSPCKLRVVLAVEPLVSLVCPNGYLPLPEQQPRQLPKLKRKRRRLRVQARTSRPALQTNPINRRLARVSTKIEFHQTSLLAPPTKKKLRNK